MEVHLKESRNRTSSWRVPGRATTIAALATAVFIAAGGAALAQFPNPCSCYYDFECKATGRGDYCSYVGDCQGGNGCDCIIKPDVKLPTVPPFDVQFPNGVLICAGPALQPKCDGVCRAQRVAGASYKQVNPEKVAQVVDLILDGYFAAGCENGGLPKREFLDAARQLAIDFPVAWQKEILSAVHDFLFVILGGDVIPPFGETTFAQIPKLSEEQKLLFETVKDAFVEAIRTGDPSLVEGPILDFWSTNEIEPLHPDHCYPHGHSQTQSVEDCMVGQLTGLLTVFVRDQECVPGSPDCDDEEPPTCDPEQEDCGGGDPPACNPEVEDCGGGEPPACNPEIEDCTGGGGEPPTCAPGTEGCGGTGATPCDPATQDCGDGAPPRDRYPGIKSNRASEPHQLDGRRSRRVPWTRDPGGRSRDDI